MRALLATMIMLLTLAGPALAQSDAPLWKEVGDWQIRVDTSLGHGCFAVSRYESGTTFRIGFDMEARKAYLIVGNDAWKSLENGKEYSLIFRFDNETPWKGAATGFAFDQDGPRFLMAQISDSEFFSEFARKNRVSITYRRTEIARLSLRGSRRALNEMFSCQHAMSRTREQAVQSKRDPFKRGSHRPASDPFR